MSSLADYGLVPVSELAPVLARAARGIPLRGRDGRLRAFTIVDAGVYDALGRYGWYRRQGYVVRNEKVAPGRYRTLGLHRAIMRLTYGDGLEVDHRDGNKLDNRRSNLRVCTHALNGQNKRSAHGSSRFRGVSWDKEHGRWRADACLNYRQVFLGRFESEQEAADAAAAWRELHMPFTTN